VINQTPVKRERSQPALTTGLVSVIIPAFNAERFVVETLQTVFDQTHHPIEIIVVDDGSTDRTAEVVAAARPAVHVVRQQNSGGCSSPRNAGLRLARGEFVNFFDADDLMSPEKLSRQVAFLRRNPDAAAVVMDYRNSDTGGPYAQTHFDSCNRLRLELAGMAPEALLRPPLATSILLEENFSIAGSPLFRRAALSESPFDESLLASEDFDLIYRTARAAAIGVIDEVGFFRRVHDSNMSGRVGHVLRYKAASREKLLRTEAHAGNRAKLRGVVRQYHLSIAEHLSREGGAPRAVLEHAWAALRFGSLDVIRLAKCGVRSVSELIASRLKVAR